MLPDSVPAIAGFTKAIGTVPDVNGLSGEFAPGAPPVRASPTAPKVGGWTLWVVVLIASVLLAVGVLLLARPFRHLVERTGALLDAVLDRRTDDGVRMRNLTGAVWNETTALLGLVVAALIVLVIAAVPLMLLGGAASPGAFLGAPFKGWNILAMLAGTTLPFVVVSRRDRGSDYSPWSRTLHRVVLDNPHLGRALFALERARSRHREARAAAHGPVIVSGLARAGTTALTTMLARSPKLHSLSYANMPFLLAPNIWRRFYKPRDMGARERSHGDKVQFSLTSVEALEDHFFKVFMGERYILDGRLVEHEVDEETLAAYMGYQRVVIPEGRPDDAYLAKNNNMILRFGSLARRMPGMRAIFLFRDPLEHASSLMAQHERFSALQRSDPFVKEYMDWLVHHEFGLGLKHFVFADGPGLPTAPPSSIDHWIGTWTAYYKRLLVLLESHPALLIDHADLLLDPDDVIRRIEVYTGMRLELPATDRFEHRRTWSGPRDEALLAEAMAVYRALKRWRDQARQ
ncbi:MAG TPA: sulfotransferase [Flavobacteriales bacterium]|nr:sulfotransferase [Flavobacteriales bacterium]HNK85715.1 sulfotransferase [Flavobacteriales bacterium]